MDAIRDANGLFDDLLNASTVAGRTTLLNDL
jgi:hypothetical protein